MTDRDSEAMLSDVVAAEAALAALADDPGGWSTSAVRGVAERGANIIAALTAKLAEETARADHAEAKYVTARTTAILIGRALGAHLDDDVSDAFLAEIPDEATAVRAKLAEAEGRDAWRPIETAPKDGTLILAWCEHPLSSATHDDDYRGPVLARWIKHNGGGWCWHGLAGTFTHWRPLPAPPPSTETAGGEG